MSAAKFKKEIQDVKSSLILMDDLHEVTSYGSKDKMQGNIDTICRDFYDYRNDSSLVITTESSVNLKFTESFLQRVVWGNFQVKSIKKLKKKNDILNIWNFDQMMY